MLYSFALLQYLGVEPQEIPYLYKSHFPTVSVPYAISWLVKMHMPEVLSEQHTYIPSKMPSQIQHRCCTTTDIRSCFLSKNPKAKITFSASVRV